MTAEQAFKNIAEREGISVAEVRNEIMLLIDEGMSSSIREVRSFWSSVPRKGEKPTPEEAVAFIAAAAKSEE